MPRRKACNHAGLFSELVCVRDGDIQGDGSSDSQARYLATPNVKHIRPPGAAECPLNQTAKLAVVPFVSTPRNPAVPKSVAPRSAP
jgi:hypothetical protein